MNDDRASTEVRLRDLRGELKRLRHDARLAAAHEVEFVAPGEHASEPVQHALSAACEEGVAIGLETALRLLGEESEQP